MSQPQLKVANGGYVVLKLLSLSMAELLADTPLVVHMPYSRGQF